MIQPAAHDIITVARSWVGTRFHHQGRLKKTDSHVGGVDCLGLLVGIAHELELKDDGGMPLAAYDETDYTHTPSAERLLFNLSRHLKELPMAALAPGCIVAMDVDRSSRHLGIISNYPSGGMGLIHAYAQARKVVEHALDDDWKKKIVKVFCL